MSEQLLGFIAEQEQAIGIIQKAQMNFRKTPKSRLTRGYVKARRETIDEYWNNFVAVNRSMIKIVKKEDMETLKYFTEDQYSAYEEFYINLKAEMTDLLEGTAQSSVDTTGNKTSNQCEEIKLPKIHIPQYNGNYQDWASFNDLFISLIHNKPHLGNVQKMHYLKSCLTGEPEQLLKHLPVTDSNYELAWNTLQGRYNNKRIIVNSILSRLINQKKINNGTAKSIRDILDTTKECLNKLKVQNVDTTSWDTIIIYLTVSKLDIETHKEWEEEVSTLKISDLPTMPMLEKFLEKRFRVLEMMQPITSTTTNPNRTVQSEPRQEVKTRSFVVAANMKCGFCNQDHPLFQCKEFQQLTLEKKTEFVQNQRLCFNCLIPGHPVKFCKNKSSCHICRKRHHSLLHRSYLSSQSPERKPELEPIPEPREREIINHLATGNITVLLSTAQINVTNDQGQEFVLRALLDPCSQESFISESAAQTMGLKRVHVNGHVSGLGQMRTPIGFAADIEISSRLKPEMKMKITTYIVKRITSILPSEKLKIENWAHLKELELADPTYYNPGHIDILLGVEVYNEVIQPGIVKGALGSPIALQTHLGWILSGKIKANEEVKRVQPFVSLHLNVELNNMLRKFWESETGEIETDQLTVEYERQNRETKQEVQNREIKQETQNREIKQETQNREIKQETQHREIKQEIQNREIKPQKQNREINQEIENNEKDQRKTRSKQEPENTHAWLDNQVTLAWIHSDPMRWKPLVKNRVLDIIQKFDSSHWYYVNTKSNPADPASRGVIPEKLKVLEIRWRGPELLKEKKVKLEKGKPLDTSLERRKEIVTVVVTQEHEIEEKLTLMQRFSSLDKLVRVVAYCRRWLNILNKEKRMYLPPYLTYEERSAALTTGIKIAQELEFPEEAEDLRSGLQLRTRSRLLPLSAFLDEKGMIRVGGRLKHADMEFVRKHPSIISRDNVLWPLSLQEAHSKTLDGSPQLMITSLRGKYWLINAGNSWKRFVRSRVIWIRQNERNSEQKMRDLPKSRVKPSAILDQWCRLCWTNQCQDKQRTRSKVKQSLHLSCVCMCTKISLEPTMYALLQEF